MFKRVLYRFGEGSTRPDGESMNMILEQWPGGTRLTLHHRAIGLLDPTHKQGVTTGWRHYLDSIQKDLS